MTSPAATARRVEHAADPASLPCADLGVTDVHQHLWPRPLVEALRSRSAPPRLRGWTLETDAEPAFTVDPASHDPVRRRIANRGSGIDRCVLSLSSPLGIEWLDPGEGQPLLDAWHRGALALGAGYQVWAAVGLREPDPTAVAAALDLGCVGLQVPADAMGSPRHLERVAALLEVCQSRGLPVLVHPGPSAGSPGRPVWWAAVVDYPAQMAAAWWAWHAEGRRLLPTLRICFAAGAGLGPVHHERLAARGGMLGAVDPDVFVDTSSYGPQGVDALVRALGIDPIVLGSGRPYAEPTDPGLGAAASRAIRCTNPRRLLEGGSA
ncbi:MAG: amidohydrolase family protein [Nocardioidaceae bacterium]